jgi:hypothetical protein
LLGSSAEKHLLSDIEPNPDACGTAIGTDVPTTSEQSSADDTSSPLPIDFLDLCQIQLDEVQELAFASYGFVDHTRPSPGPEDDDNYAAHQVLSDLCDDDVSDNDTITVLSDDDYFMDDTNDSSYLIRSLGVNISDDDLLAAVVADNAPHATALHALDFKIAQMNTSRKAFYQDLRATERKLDHRAHLDGGSMATTTDRLDLIWHCRHGPTVGGTLLLVFVTFIQID